MAQAQASGLLTDRPVEFAEQFAGLLWRDLMVSLLLGNSGAVVGQQLSSSGSITPAAR
jgi:hypothetical protein